MAKNPIMSWRNIFCADHKMWWNINAAQNMAVLCEYPYFAWNGWIYNTKSLEQISTLDAEGLN